MRFLSSIAVVALGVFGSSTAVVDAEGTQRLRGLVQGENQVPCLDPGGCPWGKLESSYTQAMWVNHTNVFWRCEQPGMVALTYDDGPSLETINTLDTLKAAGVVATFFINGIRVTDVTGPILTRMEAEGHVVAHHTYDHFSISDRIKRNLVSGAILPETTQFFERQIVQTVAVASPWLPKKGMRSYMRPPYLALDEEVATYLNETFQMYVVQINIDMKDFNRLETGQSISNRFRDNMYNETDDVKKHSWVALQHDEYAVTTAAIPIMVAHAKNLGYKFVGIDECLGFPDEPPPELLTFSPTVPPTLSCLGEPCTARPGECRSKFGFCGSTATFCGENAAWVPECVTSQPTISGPTAAPTRGSIMDRTRFYKATFEGKYDKIVHGTSAYQLQMETVIAASLAVTPASRVSAKVSGSIIVDFAIAPEIDSGDAFPDVLDDVRDDLNATFYGDLGTQLQVGKLLTLIQKEPPAPPKKPADNTGFIVLGCLAFLGAIGAILFIKKQRQGYEYENELGHDTGAANYLVNFSDNHNSMTKMQHNNNSNRQMVPSQGVNRNQLPKWRKDATERSFAGAVAVPARSRMRSSSKSKLYRAEA